MNRRARWFIPSWNGDVRLTADPTDPKKTILTVADPTEEEKISVASIGGILFEKKWLKEPITSFEKPIVIDAPLEKVGPIVVTALRPGPAVLTAVKLSGGKVEVVEHREPGVEKDLKELADKPASGGR